MQPGGTVEIIWHFIGYFPLSQSIILPRAVYETGGAVQVSGDYAVRSGPGDQVAPEAPAGASAYSPEPLVPDSQSVDFHGGFRALKLASDHHHPAPVAASGSLPPAPPPPLLAAAAGGGITWPDVTIEYVDGSAQRMVFVEQTKFMVDNDKLLVTGGSDPGDLNGVDVGHALTSMLDTALAAVPSDLNLPLTNQNATAEFIHDRDMIHAEAGPPVPPSIQPGLWINNELQPAGTSHPVLPEVREHSFDVASSDGTVAGVAATLGSNVQENLAQIIDANEAAQTVVVLGDYFKTNSIVQTNVYQDNDKITYAGPSGQTVFPAAANQANNIAEFVKKEVIDSGFKAFAGPAWHVDICNGDFLDVKTLCQQNWMIDNDVMVQTTSGAYARALMGGNTQVSLGSYFDLKHYDVIIVGGDYHAANFIFQSNVFLGDSVVKVAADLGPGHDQFLQEISWNGNTLLNDAKISDLGTQSNLPVSQEMQDLVSLLGKGETTHLDSSYGWMFNGNGTGQLNVLYVAGDYYDINVVTQTNVLSDVNSAVQYLPDVTPPRGDQRVSGDALQQSVSTGGNTQINHANITDVGTLVDQHIGGQYYEDTILIQANIIVGDNDKVTAADPTALVPEIVAFTGDSGQAPQHDPHHEIAPVKDILAHSDVMGNLVH